MGQTLNGMVADAVGVPDFVFPVPPPSYDATHPKLVWFSNRSRTTRLAAMLVRPETTTARGCIIYLHANAVDIGHALSEYTFIGNHVNCAVLAPEFPGYGILEEFSTTADGMNAVALAAYRYVVEELGFPGEEVVFYGRSIGTGPACAAVRRLATEGKPVGGLVAYAPFASLRRLVTAMAGGIAAEVVPNWWDNCSALSAGVEEVPLLIIHGASDRIISWQHGKDLFSGAVNIHKCGYFPMALGHNQLHNPEAAQAVRRLFQRKIFNILPPALEWLGHKDVQVTQ
mmetsp:Transcript_119112/g.273173  ORF Transcript_119112/g.273173 Transcript_119112/m.273173 type:complete len:285 (+) Transcript_119112:67-921(+)